MTYEIADYGKRGEPKRATVAKPTESAAVGRYLIDEYGSRKVGYCHVGIGEYELTNGRTLVVSEGSQSS